MTRSAHREAVAAFEQALGAVQHLPEHPDTLAQAIDLRLALRNALWPLGELGQIVVRLQDAHTHAEVLGDPSRRWVAVYLLAHFVVACDPDARPRVRRARARDCHGPGEVSLLVTAQSHLGNDHRSLGTIVGR